MVAANAARPRTRKGHHEVERFGAYEWRRVGAGRVGQRRRVEAPGRRGRMRPTLKPLRPTSLGPVIELFSLLRPPWLLCYIIWTYEVRRFYKERSSRCLIMDSRRLVT